MVEWKQMVEETWKSQLIVFGEVFWNLGKDSSELPGDIIHSDTC